MLAAARSPWGLAAFANLVLQLGRAARRAARRVDAEVLHAHWWVPGGLAARIAAVRTDRPYVVTLHGTDVTLLPRRRTARWLAAPVLYRAAAVTAVSSYLADLAASHTARAREDIDVVPMPIDAARFTHRSAGGGGIVTVGRLTRQKRIALLIDAVARLAAQAHPVPLTIVGDGPERPELERLVRGRGLGTTVRFTGAVEPEQIAAVLGNADVFAFPAVGEGLGLAAVEALLLGIPVVAARDGGGVTDLLDQPGAGRLAAPSAAAFAEAIHAVQADPQSRDQAWAAGQAMRERFAPEHVAHAFEAVLRRAAEGAP